ncbi:hypothetical protein ACFQWF_02225 [Methylorubrum suomiense]
MNLDRQLARLLAVVIVMIAATFGVSVAQAHEGHAHHHAPAAVEATPVQPAPVALAPAAMLAPQLAALTETPTNASTVFAVAAASAADTPDAGGCNGLCCGMNMSCCHSALTPTLQAAVPALRLATVLPAAQQDARPSLAPEALPAPSIFRLNPAFPRA